MALVFREEKGSPLTWEEGDNNWRELLTNANSRIPSTQKGVASGVATLGADGKIPVSQLPPLAVNEVFTVASQAAMLALTAERGDMAIRTDQSGQAYVLAADAPSVLANWIAIKQALAVSLVALGAVTPAADTIAYFNGPATATTTAFTAKARALLGRADNAGMRAEIAAASSGANSDITSLSGLTTPLSISQGGTGANTDAQARANLSLTKASIGATVYNAPNTVAPIGMAGWNGGPAIVKGNGANCDELVDAHLYALNGTYTNGPPTFGQAPFYLEVSVHGTGYEKQIAYGITHGGRGERTRVNYVWQPWVHTFNGVNAILDPQVAGGLMSVTTVSGFTVFKFLNGQVCLQGEIPQTATLPANANSTFNVTIPSVFNQSFSAQPSISIVPLGDNDFGGSNACLADATVVRIHLRNGATAQQFRGQLTVWGRWK